jgi:hypothetical protein
VKATAIGNVSEADLRGGDVRIVFHFEGGVRKSATRRSCVSLLHLLLFLIRGMCLAYVSLLVSGRVP